VAETEKYAHVTFFFNGGREEPFDGERRVLVPSPQHVPTYDHAPEMSAAGVRDAVVQALAENADELLVVNFANADMVATPGWSRRRPCDRDRGRLHGRHPAGGGRRRGPLA
jgi:2,3-bisphosphoglycerate-independent phosphoglycerate mutase